MKTKTSNFVLHCSHLFVSLQRETINIMQKLIFSLSILLAVCCGCTSQKKPYTIGVSQCSGDIWREKQNAELLMSSYLHDNVELSFATAYDSDERQVQQIDSLVNSGIDLLIVAPNQIATITPAIDRAYDSGIPVIVFERKTDSQKFTAFMSADNYEMGRQMGEFVASQLKGTGRVMEIMGLKGSSPAIDRHKGFTDALSNHPGIELVATLQGDWTEQSAYQAVADYRGDLSHIDFVFGQNDRMAMGARRAMMDNGNNTQHFCGIDGLPGEDGGIRLVRDSILDASYIYPTHGDRLLQLALDILDGKPYEKETHLMSALVTRDNANVLLMQSEEIMRQTAYLNQLHKQADTYLQELDTQRTATWLFVGLIIVLLLFIVFIYYYFIQKARLAHERTKMEREQLDFYTQVSHELRTPLTLIEGPLAQLGETQDLRQASPEATSMFDIVSRNTRQLSELINKMLTFSVNDNANLNPNAQQSTLNNQPSTLNAQHSTLNSPLSTPNTQLLLIVDDNADIRTYLRTILQDHYQLLEAADGQEGWTLANEQVPDLIISDVMMPVMNGLQFCQLIKDNMATSHVPVILLTARALSKHQVEGYRSGADAYITKPFQPDVLQARIENLLHQRQQLRELWTTDNANDNVNANNAQPSTPNAQPSTPNAPQEAGFIQRFRQVVEKHMSDSDLSVEDIGSELGLSRVQLYRKVKALTSLTPVEQLRKARLTRARQLLESTDLSISEVAYQVGFTAPSYFTKCFKEEYDMLPGDVRGR